MCWMNAKDIRKTTSQNTRLKCVEEISASDGYELIIVPTNMHQIEGARLRRSLYRFLERRPFLSSPATGKGPNALTACYSGSVTYLDTQMAVERSVNGIYWTNLGAEIHIGEADGKPSEKLEKVKALFVHADMKPDVQENIVHWLWQHAASAIGFALGFAKHGDIKTFLEDKELVHQCVLSTKELYRLCALRGVDLKKFPEASFINFPDWLVTFLVRWNMTHREAAQRYSAHGASTGSQQEMRLYYAGVMKAANELSFEMPYTKALRTSLK